MISQKRKPFNLRVCRLRTGSLGRKRYSLCLKLSSFLNRWIVRISKLSSLKRLSKVDLWNLRLISWIKVHLKLWISSIALHNFHLINFLIISRQDIEKVHQTTCTPNFPENIVLEIKSFKLPSLNSSKIYLNASKINRISISSWELSLQLYLDAVNRPNTSSIWWVRCRIW